VLYCAVAWTLVVLQLGIAAEDGLPLSTFPVPGIPSSILLSIVNDSVGVIAAPQLPLAVCEPNSNM